MLATVSVLYCEKCGSIVLEASYYRQCLCAWAGMGIGTSFDNKHWIKAVAHVYEVEEKEHG